MVLAHEIGERIVCAVKLSYGCRSDPQLAGPYGELAGKVRENAPRIVYERGMTALPVDFRSCRSPACSDGPETGRATRSRAGRPVTLFTHLIDCREPARAASRGYDCSGERAGRVYIQYWEYYADSATSRALLGARGFHDDDWEGVQIRINRGRQRRCPRQLAQRLQRRRRACRRLGFGRRGRGAGGGAGPGRDRVAGPARRPRLDPLRRDPVRVGRQPRRSCDRGLAAASARRAAGEHEAGVVHARLARTARPGRSSATARSCWRTGSGTSSSGLAPGRPPAGASGWSRSSPSPTGTPTRSWSPRRGGSASTGTPSTQGTD